jgi:hypothetical protein
MVEFAASCVTSSFVTALATRKPSSSIIALCAGSASIRLPAEFATR